MLAYRTIIATEGMISEGAASYAHRRSALDSQLKFGFTDKHRNGNGFRDPAFSGNKTQPLHRWVPWIAGFSSQFVQDCFETFLRDRKNGSKPRVLDPFAGVGTTLVQAMLNGFNSVGFEINPYAALACKAKLNASKLRTDILDTYLADYRKTVTMTRRPIRVAGPAEFKTRIPFFSNLVEDQVLTFLDFTKRIHTAEIADLFWVAFGSVMVSFSNYTYEPSLGSRPGAGKPLIENADVHSTIMAKLFDMVSDIRWIRKRLKDHSCEGEREIHNLDFLESANILPSGSIDLIVTSPPYMNNYHYVRNTRPQLFWLSLISSSKQLRKLEEANFGKYWQTVRDGEPIEPHFDHPELVRILKRLRETREERGAYGGPGWANYVTAYFNDCDRFCKVLKRVLARGGIGVVVIGNSIIQGHEIKTDLILADLARQSGLNLLGVQKIRLKRIGASITTSAVRRGDKSRAMLYESAVIFRKK